MSQRLLLAGPADRGVNSGPEASGTDPCVAMTSFMKPARSSSLTASGGMTPSPFVAPLALLWPELRPVGYAGLAATAAYLATVVLLRCWAGPGVLSMLLGPLTAPLASALMVRTALLGKRRGGAVWRGTLYSEADLRAGQRVRFP